MNAQQLGTGPPPALQDEAHDESEAEAPEAGEPALPNGDPPTGMARVVAPVGHDVRRRAPTRPADEHPDGEGGEALDAEAGAGESPASVQVGDVGRDREARSRRCERPAGRRGRGRERPTPSRGGDRAPTKP